MPQLILDLNQVVIERLNRQAAEAKEPLFASQDAKGMLEYRLTKEVRELLLAEMAETNHQKAVLAVDALLNK